MLIISILCVWYYTKKWIIIFCVVPYTFWAPSILVVVFVFCLYIRFMHYLLIVKLFCDIYSIHYILMYCGINIFWILNLESITMLKSEEVEISYFAISALCTTRDLQNCWIAKKNYFVILMGLNTNGEVFGFLAKKNWKRNTLRFCN